MEMGIERKRDGEMDMGTQLVRWMDLELELEMDIDINIEK